MIYLHGGGWVEDESSWTGLFVDEAAARAGGPPLIAVVLWDETAEAGAAFHDDYRDDLVKLGAGEVRIVQLAGDDVLDEAVLEGVHGLFVGGGLTPAYHRALLPCAAAIRDAVASGLPYLGMSAGAMIAGDTAVLGGWRHDGVPVVPQDASEGLDGLTLAPGLGLFPFAADAHTGRGLLGRTVALVASGLVRQALAIDEDTCAVLGPDGAVRAAGLGSVWLSRADPSGEVRITRLTASTGAASA